MLSNHVVPAVKCTSCSQYMFAELDSVRFRAAFWLGGRWGIPFVFSNSSGCTFGPPIPPLVSVTPLGPLAHCSVTPVGSLVLTRSVEACVAPLPPKGEVAPPFDTRHSVKGPVGLSVRWFRKRGPPCSLTFPVPLPRAGKRIRRIHVVRVYFYDTYVLCEYEHT